MWNLEEWNWWTYLQGRNRERRRCREQLVDPAGEGEGGMNWEGGTDAYTLACVKQAASWKLLHSRGSSAQCTPMREGWEKFVRPHELLGQQLKICLSWEFLWDRFQEGTANPEEHADRSAAHTHALPARQFHCTETQLACFHGTTHICHASPRPQHREDFFCPLIPLIPAPTSTARDPEPLWAGNMINHNSSQHLARTYYNSECLALINSLNSHNSNRYCYFPHS